MNNGVSRCILIVSIKKKMSVEFRSSINMKPLMRFCTFLSDLKLLLSDKKCKFGYMLLIIWKL